MLVRIAALVAVDAPAVSYVLNLGVASRGRCRRRASPWCSCRGRADCWHGRVASATGKIVKGLGVAIEIVAIELDEESDD